MRKFRFLSDDQYIGVRTDWFQFFMEVSFFMGNSHIFKFFWFFFFFEMLDSNALHTIDESTQIVCTYWPSKFYNFFAREIFEEEEVVSGKGATSFESRSRSRGNIRTWSNSSVSSDEIQDSSCRCRLSFWFLMNLIRTESYEIQVQDSFREFADHVHVHEDTHYPAIFDCLKYIKIIRKKRKSVENETTIIIKGSRGTEVSSITLDDDPSRFSRYFQVVVSIRDIWFFMCLDDFTERQYDRSLTCSEQEGKINIADIDINWLIKKHIMR